jgi:hypothetical protein
MLCVAKAAFILIGLAFSTFYAYKAVDIHVWPNFDSTPPKMKRSWWFHQYWLNFVGSAVGWIAAYYYIFHRILLPDFAFKIEDTVPILVAVLGVTVLAQREMENRRSPLV